MPRIDPYREDSGPGRRMEESRSRPRHRSAPDADAGVRPVPIAHRRARIALALVSTLALVVTGVAWKSVDSLRSNLATVSGLGLGGGSDGAVDILMVGTDSRTDARGNALSQQELDSLRAGEEVASNTDTIVLIRVPNDGSSATAISIPRDAYVQVPGIGMSKINAAYGATKEEDRLKLVESGVPDAQADEQSSKAGRTALIESVAQLTGVTVDHYAEVGLLGFVLLTDAVGGVDVCLNAPVDEPLSGADFPAGPQTLTGSNALSFVRQRHDLPRGDLDRIVRQQVFMASLVHKVLSGRTLSDPSKLSALSAAVQRSVTIDSDWDILDFATNLQDLAGGQVKFQTIPVVDIDAVTDYGESIVQVDPAAVKKYVSGLIGDGASSETTSNEGLDPTSITVDVANDSGIEGLASTVSTALSSAGFVAGQVGNYDGASMDATTVLAADATSPAAEAVAAQVGNAPIETDPSLGADTVRVVLATDYAGPGSGVSDTATPETQVAQSQAGVSPAGDSATPAPAAPPIDAGRTGPACVN